MARSSLKELNSSLDEFKMKKVMAEAQLDLEKSELNEYVDAPAEVTKAIELYRDVQERLSAAKVLASQKAALDRAAISQSAAIQDISSLEYGINENVAEFDKFMVDIDARICLLNSRLADRVTTSTADIAELQKQIDAIPYQDLTALQNAETHHKALSAEHKMLKNAEITLRERYAALDERAKALEEEADAGKALQKTLKSYEAEISRWTLLSKALSKDGIVALCIDDAGPTLASITNDLLMSCYGPRFTVSIETQAQSLSGAAKETFDVRVLDGDTDDDKSVRSMSGGERIYINEAMTRAIALYQAQQSGKQYGTLFSDESDGALDPDRKIMFTSMKRKVLELGGYDREIFITHTPELYDLADAVIDLNSMKA
ncbi:MAG: hypothetical protein ACWGQW_12635 [bacterium]